jgi:Sec-independent protein translocase protein TatA
MFGVGPQEVVAIVFLLLVVFGPGKAVGMARDLGGLANVVRNHVEEFKGELLHGEDHDELVSDPRSEDEFELSLPEKGRLPEKTKTAFTEGAVS